jgi:hypothetical protein
VKDPHSLRRKKKGIFSAQQECRGTVGTVVGVVEGRLKMKIFPEESALVAQVVLV